MIKTPSYLFLEFAESKRTADDNFIKSFQTLFTIRCSPLPDKLYPAYLPELHFHAAGAYVKEDGKHKNDAAYCVLIGLPDAHEVHAVLERR